jgi:putative transposase
VIRKARGYNRTKVVNKLADLHAKVAKVGKNALHKLTYYLAKNPGEVKIEDLSIKAFLKYQNLADAIADYGMYKVQGQR